MRFCIHIQQMLLQSVHLFTRQTKIKSVFKMSWIQIFCQISKLKSSFAWKTFVCQPVDKPKLRLREMLDFGERLAQIWLLDEWVVKVTTDKPIL